MQFNEERLKEILGTIIEDIKARKTEDKQAIEFNRLQLQMFRRMLQDVCFSVDMDYSEETEDILHTWKQSYNGDRGYYFMNYIYGISDNNPLRGRKTA